MLEILNKYINNINNCNNKEDMKIIVRNMFRDIELDDIDFNDIIYDYVIPKLKKLGCDMTYNETYDITNYEKVMKELY